MIKYMEIKSSKRSEFIDITGHIQNLIDKEISTGDGICYLYVPHTTAALTINEGADPSVKRDIVTTLTELIPHVANYQHMEGNSDAHIKASLFGSSEVLLIENGRLALGTWQAVYFCEFDGPRERKLAIKIMEG
ncbi:MAG: YjbQ family protein [Proteobacteria bacterium]|nr:YjbQ family protein [Pseudomonadota bacterium]